MCIALLTTLHPTYPLIILNNRDEFILRPTSRPHWWSPSPSPSPTPSTNPSPSSPQEVLSSRDLHRPEHGTWLGVTKAGHVAVLTNYREESALAIGARSRGGMVTAWLGAEKGESTAEFVERLVGGDGEGVKGVGGFSLVAGRLRLEEGAKGENGKQLEKLAVISNRVQGSEEVPWIGQEDGVWGLSNTALHDPVKWPKVEMGKDLVERAVKEAIKAGEGEEELVDRLWGVLDTDTLPARVEGEDFEKYSFQLRNSIFIPGFGSEETEKLKAEDIAAAGIVGHAAIAHDNGKEKTNGFDHGLYGTQRQTLILVDWHGKVSFRERSLWDETGKPISRGAGDVKYEFQVEGWNGD